MLLNVRISKTRTQCGMLPIGKMAEKITSADGANEKEIRRNGKWIEVFRIVPTSFMVL